MQRAERHEAPSRRLPENESNYTENRQTVLKTVGTVEKPCGILYVFGSGGFRVPTDLFYSTGQAARELGISPATVRALCAAGAIECQSTPGGQ